MNPTANKSELQNLIINLLEKLIEKTDQHTLTTAVSISDESLQALNLQLETLFIVNKIFRDPELTSKKLADILGTNTTYLSYIINTKYNCSIPKFINRHRITEAKVLLSDNEYITMRFDSLAQLCGFNSKSSFNRSFKSEEGITPMEYKNFRHRGNGSSKK